MDMLTFAMLKRYVDSVVEVGAGMTPSEVANLQTSMNKLQASFEETQVQVAELSTAVAGKVDAVEGKGLSANDFTDELKNKLINLSDEDGDIDIVKVNNVDLEITDGAVNIPVASQGVHGVVTSSSDPDKISILEDGTMQLNSISLNKIVQDDSSSVIFVGGNSDGV